MGITGHYELSQLSPTHGTAVIGNPHTLLPDCVLTWAELMPEGYGSLDSLAKMTGPGEAETVFLGPGLS